MQLEILLSLASFQHWFKLIIWLDNYEERILNFKQIFPLKDDLKRKNNQNLFLPE